MILYFFAVRTRVGPPSRFLHPPHLPRQIQTGMHRRHHHALGTAHGKRHPQVHLRLLQAHRLRRQRKAHRKRLAAARGGYGKAGKRHEPHGRTNPTRLPALSGQFKITNFKIQNYFAMNKETLKYIIQTAIAILTAILTTLGVTSCMGAA